MSMDIERIGFWDRSELTWMEKQFAEFWKQEDKFREQYFSDTHDAIMEKLAWLRKPVEVVYHEPKVLDAEQIEMLREKPNDMRPYKPAFYTDKD